MPSGITAAIYKGKEVSRDEFLMRVARSYSLAIMQREDDPDAPVRRCEPNTKYREDAIEAAEETLRDLSALTVEQASERAKAEHEKEAKEWREAKAKALNLRARYEAMAREVEAWEPEPLVAGIKDVALKYLRESIDFDCGEPGQEMRYRPYPQLLSGAEWINSKREKAQRDIDYHRDLIAAEIKHADERNEYIDAFYRSLKGDE